MTATFIVVIAVHIVRLSCSAQNVQLLLLLLLAMFAWLLGLLTGSILSSQLQVFVASRLRDQRFMDTRDLISLTCIAFISASLGRLSNRC